VVFTATTRGVSAQDDGWMLVGFVPPGYVDGAVGILNDTIDFEWKMLNGSGLREFYPEDSYYL
jgi:hypothetical protein